MLTKDAVWARFFFALCFFLLSGSGMVSGWPATLCGILGTVELASSLLHYSPGVEIITQLSAQRKIDHYS